MRTATALVAVLTLVAVLSGCSSGGAGDRDTLRVWLLEANTPQISKAYDALVADFERRHPGTRVELSRVPYLQYRDKLVLAEQGGTGPDVMALDQIWMPEFAAAGLIRPLDAEVPSRWGKEYFPGAWESNQWRGHRWGMPLNADVWQRMFYNADLFRKAGLDPDSPPRTWAEWLDAAKRIDRLPGADGIGVIGCRDEATTVWTDSLVYSAGGHILSGGDADFDTDATVRAYTMFERLARHAPNGVPGACADDTTAQFTAGRTGMVLLGGWSQGTVDEQAKFDWRVGTTPAPAGHRFVGALGGWNLAVGSHTRHAGLAVDFAKLATTSERHQLGVNDSVPALRSAGEKFVRDTRAHPAEMLELMEQGRPRPVTPVYNRVSRAQQDAAQAILGGTPVREALRDADATMQNAIDRP